MNENIINKLYTNSCDHCAENTNVDQELPLVINVFEPSLSRYQKIQWWGLGIAWFIASSLSGVGRWPCSQ